jgi:hypothetical protein
MIATVPSSDTPSPKRAGGRPKSTEPKPARATVRFTKIEYLVVKQRAGNARLTVAEYCRQAVLTGKVSPTLDPAMLPALHELRALGNTLNQLAKLAHTDGIRSVGFKADKLLDQLSKLLTV